MRPIGKSRNANGTMGPAVTMLLALYSTAGVFGVLAYDLDRRYKVWADDPAAAPEIETLRQVREQCPGWVQQLIALVLGCLVLLSLFAIFERLRKKLMPTRRSNQSDSE